jgi:uncharacterized membrane protein YqjE
MPQSQRPETTAELAREALGELRELVTLEVALAREEVKAEIAQLKTAVLTLGIAAALAIAALSLLLVTVAAAVSPMWLAAFVIGVILAVTAVTVGTRGYRRLPRRPAPLTRERLESDVKRLRERMT